MPSKPCVELVNGRHCGRLSPNTRCEEHQSARDAARAADPTRPYNDPRYRRWREIVRLRAGGRCQQCGRTEAETGRAHQADHIVAVLDGGERFDPRNGQLLCVDCHADKSKADRRRRRNAKGAPKGAPTDPPIVVG
jgi:5-methylcytosine-specific restriction endonuclease McrA